MGIFEQVSSFASSSIAALFSEAKKAEKNIQDLPKPSKVQYDPIGMIYDPKDPTKAIIIDHNIQFQEEGGIEWSISKPRGAVGSIYTYNMTNERTFPLHFTITDYNGDGKIIRGTKDLLRVWNKPRVSKGKIIAPPPVLEFWYKGFIEPDRAVRCVLTSYSIQGDVEDGWNINTETPYTIDVAVTLAEIGVVPRGK